MSTWHLTNTGKVVEFTDAQYEECVKEGFSRTPDGREAAAWWILFALPNLCSGDRTQLFHDYPARKEHLLASSAGRVIEATPDLAHIDGHLEVIGMRGDTWSIEIYADVETSDTEVDLAGAPVVVASSPIAYSGQVVIAIDSAQGVGKTNSIVLAVDKRTRRILACFWDNAILHDDLARVVQMLAKFFAPRQRNPRHNDSVTVVCEADGAGRHTAHELTFLGVPHELFWQSKNANAERCITQAKRRIESVPRGAPLVLQEECDELRRDEKNQLKGRKDCLMMFGIASIIIDDRPYNPPIDVEAEKDRRSRMSFEDSLRDSEASKGVAWRPRWGS